MMTPTIHYKVSYTQANSRQVCIEITICNYKKDSLLVELPSWRPGRYELGNFAKNVLHFQVSNGQGAPLAWSKVSKDSWEVMSENNDQIKISYLYHAAQLDAGACWLDNQQLYINGVHCFAYVPDLMNETCTLQIEVPSDYIIAIGLDKIGNQLYKAANYHQLIDCPFIAAKQLQYQTYTVEETLFHIWFHGEAKPDWEQIVSHFEAFTRQQMLVMKHFPATEYHFLVQLLPYTFHHGVEHTNNTVLAFGPGYKLMDKTVYQDFLGLSSHELFHAWNIKTIRPVEMWPYNYKQENYSRLGYVAEGVTTYYGDLFCCRAGVWTSSAFLEELSATIQRHLHNYGRFNMSVAEASFDTWLDGYQPGVPHRKVSIYDEGALMAFVLDIKIRENTNNAHSLDHVMHHLYHHFALHQQGYSETDYKTIATQYAQQDLTAYFEDYVYGTYDYEPLLNVSLSYVGLLLEQTASKNAHENLYGFKLSVEAGMAKVLAVAPQSPAYVAGLAKDHELLSINGYKITPHNVVDWFNYFADNSSIQLEVMSLGQISTLELTQNGVEYYKQVHIRKNEQATDAQQANYLSWCGQPF